MTVPPLSVPPDGVFREGIRVERVAHGANVIVGIRVLRPGEEFDNRSACLMMAWYGLTSALERAGVDTRKALDTMPRLK